MWNTIPVLHVASVMQLAKQLSLIHSDLESLEITAAACLVQRALHALPNSL